MNEALKRPLESSTARKAPVTPGSRADRLNWQQEEADRARYTPRNLPPEPEAILEYYEKRREGRERAKKIITEMAQSGNEVRIAIQKNGRLSAIAWGLLETCMQAAGVPMNEEGRERQQKNRTLVYEIPKLPNVKIVSARSGDIAWYVESGNADIGIIGEDQILEKKSKVEVVARLGLGECSLAIAVPEGSPITSLKDLNGKTIATSLPTILKNYLKSKGVKAKSIIELGGSVEAATALGFADAVCDITETGSSFVANGLTELETVRDFEAVVITTKKPRVKSK
ncbi:MAG: ATP phosphoribosyltransferase [Parcubacteria group bacterium Greene0714_7]|nr:MAG: ATP phosphoribosyltransferase [Parcubacteria group bacterium Greene0714_7]